MRQGAIQSTTTTTISLLYVEGLAMQVAFLMQNRMPLYLSLDGIEKFCQRVDANRETARLAPVLHMLVRLDEKVLRM